MHRAEIADAFRKLYDETRRETLIYLTARCADPGDAADLFQETYAEAYAALCRRGPAYVRSGEAFVKKLAAQQLHRHYRRRELRREVPLEAVEAAVPAPPEEIDDPLPDALPEGLSPTFDDASTWRYADYDGLLWDQFAFTWREHPADWEGYDPLERSLTVTAATGEIFTCAIWMFDEEMAPSEIGGVTMMLGRREVSYGPYTDGPDGEKLPAGYYPMLEAQFEYGGLRFQVRAENVTEAEFLAALRSMVD